MQIFQMRALHFKVLRDMPLEQAGVANCILTTFEVSVHRLRS